MELYSKYLIFTISFLLLSLYVFINYKIGVRRGIKKSLYRVTYTSLCVIFAFILAPYVNEYILNYDLYAVGGAIRYNGLHFYRIIDFIEEVIVHNEVLNDIYNLFPSLKDLLMDFPQVLFIPFTYVIMFIVMNIIFLPLYLFLGYKRKRRVLYDKTYSKKDRIWAGVINAVQSVFLVSIVLTPINGLMRIYKDAHSGLIDSDSNICKENQYLEKYAFACEIIEGYNASVLGLLGKSPINEYVYDSLTRIKYGDSDTSLNKEIVSVARAGVILNNTGLLNAISSEDFTDVTKLNFKGLTEEDIDIVVKAFEQSLYTREVLYDVYEWAKAYLDWLIKDFVDEDFSSNYAYEDIVGELKIILRTINYIIDNKGFLENVAKVYRIVDDYINLPPRKQTGSAERKLFFDIVYAIDLDYLYSVFNLLKDSKIYKDFVPQILNHLLRNEGIASHLTSARTDELNQTIVYVIGLARIIQSHRYIYNVMQLLASLTMDDIHYIAIVVEYLNSSETLRTFLYDLANFGINEAQLKLEIPTEIIFEIKDWDRELELAALVLQIIYTQMSQGYIDYDKAWYALTHYNDTIAFETAFKYAIKLLPEVFTMWIAGKDYKYLVGEYVQE